MLSTFADLQTGQPLSGILLNRHSIRQFLDKEQLLIATKDFTKDAVPYHELA